ncbi:hypothetical protein [Pseudomonas monteilii]|uniref:hypothetical protein n=1 Tax=Pseudomonas monteilii TaxID=76759 RepID=UPI0015F8E79B|nr:hypothetical protein [Pseudomonas monteilii]MBA6105266.1 hypothetical protein [Pseudomonas monteilii]
MSQQPDFQKQSLPDPSWAKMDPLWVVEYLRNGSKFDADKIEQMLQFAIDAAKNTQAMTLTLDSNAVEALARYRQALSAFQEVGHGTDQGADLYLDAERAAEDLGKQIAALAPTIADEHLLHGKEHDHRNECE